MGNRYFKNVNEILVVTKDIVGIANLCGYYYKDEDGLHRYDEGNYDLKHKCEVNLSSYGVTWGNKDIYNKDGEKVKIEEIEDAYMEGVFYHDGRNHVFVELISDESSYEEVEVETLEDKIVVTEYTITNGSKKLQKIEIDGDETFAVYCTASAYQGDWCDKIYLISDEEAETIIDDKSFRNVNLIEASNTP